MNSEQVQVILKRIDELWANSHNTQSMPGASEVVPFAWNGYGWREERTGLVVSPFVENSEDLSPIVAEFESRLPHEVKVEGLVMPRFREMRAKGQSGDPDTPLRPGNVVFTGCPDACVGTIGAFLIGQSERWLLSNRHILAECTSPDGVMGVNNFPIGTDVRPVAAQDNGNVVDAALVKVENTSEIDPTFRGIERLVNAGAAALPKLHEMESVQKLGRVTNLTSGNLVLHCPKVKISDCSDKTTREFDHQLAVVSAKKGKLFADEGDSGSVVVAGTRPIGLLFAQTIPADSETPNEQSVQAPIFLANRWDLVMQELSKVVGGRLSLMLGKRMAAAS